MHTFLKLKVRGIMHFSMASSSLASTHTLGDLVGSSICFQHELARTASIAMDPILTTLPGCSKWHFQWMLVCETCTATKGSAIPQVLVPTTVLLPTLANLSGWTCRESTPGSLYGRPDRQHKHLQAKIICGSRPEKGPAVGVL